MTSSVVDVVIPTRNRRDLVMGAIDDALSQRGVEVRCYVVDDASEDGTADAVEGLGDTRITVIRHGERGGVGRMRNSGIRRGSGPWIAFLDDDDRWAPDKLEAQLAAIEAEPGARWAVSGSVNFDENGVRGGQGLPGGGGAVLDRLLLDCVVPAGGSNVVVSRDLIESVGGFDERLGAAEDWDLWLRLAERSPIAYVDRPLVGYRRWTRNTSRDPELMGTYRRFVLGRYADLRNGAEYSRADLQWERWRAAVTLRNGRRLRAARLYAQIAVADRAPGQVAYAAGALLAPKAVERRLGQVGIARMPFGWAEQVESWLGTAACAIQP
jgi:glycosyltransferase involved in cell wall biosynthesis